MDIEPPLLAKVWFIIAFAGMAVTLVGAILLLVAAFNESLLWGLGVIFVPFVNIAFLFFHWAEAKKGFFICLLGTALTGGGVWMTFKTIEDDPTLAKAMGGLKFTTSADHPGKTSPKPDSTGEDSNLEQKVRIQAEIQATQGAIAGLQRKVSEEYPRLTERRKSLKTSDPQAVQAFNALVATYDRDNRELAAKNERLAQLWKELDALAKASSQMAREERANSPATSQVVLYTTSWCPSCKQAKDYLAQHGIAYEEKDVEHSQEAAVEFRRRGGGGVPMVVVNGQQMTGFSPQWVQRQLGK